MLNFSVQFPHRMPDWKVDPELPVPICLLGAEVFQSCPILVLEFNFSSWSLLPSSPSFLGDTFLFISQKIDGWWDVFIRCNDDLLLRIDPKKNYSRFYRWTFSAIDGKKATTSYVPNSKAPSTMFHVFEKCRFCVCARRCPIGILCV